MQEKTLLAVGKHAKEHSEGHQEGNLGVVGGGINGMTEEKRLQPPPSVHGNQIHVDLFSYIVT
jgi:hypothetical protein